MNTTRLLLVTTALSLATIPAARAETPLGDEACETVKRLKAATASDRHFMSVITAASLTLSGFAADFAAKRYVSAVARNEVIEQAKAVAVQNARRARELSAQMHRRLEDTITGFLEKELEAISRNAEIREAPTKIGRRLAERMPGLGRALADELARGLRIPFDDAYRLANLATHQLKSLDLEKAVVSTTSNLTIYPNKVMRIDQRIPLRSDWAHQVGRNLTRELKSPNYERYFQKVSNKEVAAHVVQALRDPLKLEKVQKVAKALRAGGKVLKVAGPVLGVAMEILFASEARAETLTSVYTREPDRLLIENTAEQACDFLKSQNAGTVPERIVVLGAFAEDVQNGVDELIASETMSFAQPETEDAQSEQAGDGYEAPYCPEDSAGSTPLE